MNTFYGQSSKPCGMAKYRSAGADDIFHMHAISSSECNSNNTLPGHLQSKAECLATVFVVKLFVNSTHLFEKKGVLIPKK